MIYLLKNTIQWLKNHLGLFKTIFLISVIVIIVGELMSIGKTLSIQQLGETFATIPVWKSGLMLLIGLGYLMEIRIDLWQTIPLFIAASVIGIVSMIPGEIGSFDVMMIIGLSAIGVPREIVVVWILLYRLFYYIIPFLIGIVFFFKNIGSTFDQRYSGIPKQLATEIAHKIVVVLLYFSGIMLVLSATIPQAFTEFRWLHSLNPLKFHFIIQFPSILLGFLLIIMGRGIAARVKRAYLPTIFLIVLALLYVLLSDFSFTPVVFLSILLLIILASKNELFREQLIYSWEWRTIDGIIIGALSLLFRSNIGYG